MGTIVDTLKNNLVTVVGLVSSVGMVITAYITFTSSFVLAAEYKKDQEAQVQAIQQVNRYQRQRDDLTRQGNSVGND